jgi:hypothetical protein
VEPPPYCWSYVLAVLWDISSSSAQQETNLHYIFRSDKRILRVYCGVNAVRKTKKARRASRKCRKPSVIETDRQQCRCPT